MSDEGVDKRRRRFLTVATSVVGGVGVSVAATPFVASFQPSAKAKALGAPVEVDISKLQPGQRLVEKWRGRPVWILRRVQTSVDNLSKLSDALSDPDSVEPQQPDYAQNAYRSQKPEYLIIEGLCTHLGCAPTYLPAGDEHEFGDDWYGGFFCPCHGSRFDLAGRVYKGVPAPTNMVVPPHRFASETVIVIGEDQEAVG